MQVLTSTKIWEHRNEYIWMNEPKYKDEYIDKLLYSDDIQEFSMLSIPRALPITFTLPVVLSQKIRKKIYPQGLNRIDRVICILAKGVGSITSFYCNANSPLWLQSKQSAELTMSEKVVLHEQEVYITNRNVNLKLLKVVLAGPNLLLKKSGSNRAIAIAESGYVSEPNLSLPVSCVIYSCYQEAVASEYWDLSTKDALWMDPVDSNMEVIDQLKMASHWLTQMTGNCLNQSLNVFRSMGNWIIYLDSIWIPISYNNIIKFIRVVINKSLERKCDIISTDPSTVINIFIECLQTMATIMFKPGLLALLNRCGANSDDIEELIMPVINDIASEREIIFQLLRLYFNGSVDIECGRYDSRPPAAAEESDIQTSGIDEGYTCSWIPKSLYTDQCGLSKWYIHDNKEMNLPDIIYLDPITIQYYIGMAHIEDMWHFQTAETIPMEPYTDFIKKINKELEIIVPAVYRARIGSPCPKTAESIVRGHLSVKTKIPNNNDVYIYGLNGALYGAGSSIFSCIPSIFAGEYFMAYKSALELTKPGEMLLREYKCIFTTKVPIYYIVPLPNKALPSDIFVRLQVLFMLLPSWHREGLEPYINSIYTKFEAIDKYLLKTENQTYMSRTLHLEELLLEL